MKVLPRLLVVLFVAFLTADCLLIINNLVGFRAYTKPLLMPVLYILLAVQTVNTTHKHSKLYISLALFFCFAGDFLLLDAEDNSHFIMGLGCFFAGHICYSLFFLRLKGFSIKRIVPLMLVGIFIIAYLWIVVNNLWFGITAQRLTAPVVAYAIVIGFMALTASQVAMGRRLTKVAWRNFVPGALLFIASDTMLAVQKFTMAARDAETMPYVLLSLGTMVTYGLAQLLLMLGAIKIIKA